MSTKNFVSYGDAETLFTGVGNKLSTLKSGLTTLDNEVNGDATVYPYADVITIEDAVPSNLADCNIKIEPDQDLHGYDKPWVGGAGKNKLPLVLADIKTANTDGTWNGNVYTINGGTFTVYTDDGGNITKIVANGTFSTRSTLRLRTSNDNYVLTQGSYIVSKGFTNSNVGIAIETFNGTTWVSRLTASTSTDNVSFTVDYDGYDRLYVYLEVTNTSSAVNETFYPMIRLSTETDATFAPYTNICPITGHTEASVQRDGKNLFPSNNAFVVSNNGDMVEFATKGNTEYIISMLLSRKSGVTITNDSINIFVAEEYDANNAMIKQRGSGSKYLPSGSTDVSWSKSFTTDSRTVSIKLYLGNNNGDFNANTIKSNIQLELGSSATDYEPYQGKTYTIALGDTYYKGLLDVDTGVFTSYNVKRVLNDPDKWISTSGNIVYKYNEEFSDRKQYASDSYAGVFTSFISIDPSSQYTGRWQASDSNYFGIRDDNSLITLEQLKTRASAGDLSICYELATPFTVQLTPQQIQLLKGTNTITASTGQISVTVNGVSGAIGAVQEQANVTDAALAELAADIAEQLPDAPTTDGAYVLTVTVADGTPTYSWESAT